MIVPALQVGGHINAANCTFQIAGIHRRSGFRNLSLNISLCPVLSDFFKMNIYSVVLGCDPDQSGVVSPPGPQPWVLHHALLL